MLYGVLPIKMISSHLCSSSFVISPIKYVCIRLLFSGDPAAEASNIYTRINNKKSRTAGTPESALLNNSPPKNRTTPHFHPVAFLEPGIYIAALFNLFMVNKTISDSKTHRPDYKADRVKKDPIMI